LDLVEKTLRDSKFNGLPVINKIDAIFTGKANSEKFYKWYLKRFWLEKFNSSLKSSARWDTLTHYSFIANKHSLLVSHQNLVRDLGFSDLNAMNPRSESKPGVHFENIKDTHDGFKFCLQCEKGNSRVGSSSQQIIINSLKYRSKKIKYIGKEK
jgi:hypothetical protein